MDRRTFLVPLACFAFMARAAAPLPSFEELERQGAVIGTVRVKTDNIFDPDHPGEGYRLYGWVNRLHVVTRPSVIEGKLLFRSGERISTQRLAETERLLRNLRTLHDVEIRPVRVVDGVVDIEVATRDTWSLDLTGSFSTSGGQNKSSFGVLERNLLGTGLLIGYSKVSDIDRSGNELDIAYTQAFDGWTRLTYRRGSFSDGKRSIYEIDRPFYSFDTRWAARAAHADDDRIDSIYNTGDVVSEYRHVVRNSDASWGWSPGLVGRWTQRFSVGAMRRDDRYAAEPGRVAPVPLPVDHEVRGPFLRYDLLEDDFIKVKNFNRIQRPEFIGLGFAGSLQVGRSLASWGSSVSSLLYAANVSGGWSLGGEQKALARAWAERRIGSTGEPLTHTGVGANLYMPFDAARMVYAALTADHVEGGGVPDELVLGGEEGLRGYPNRYQSGRQRVRATVEGRYYTDWYPFRLVRVGGAVFFDTGRAWASQNANRENGGWLKDVGIGLRLAIDRTSSDNVLHIDIAVPLDPDTDVKRVQFIVKTKFSF